MNKICICFFLLGIVVVFHPSENLYGEEFVFNSESISEVDLEMALYDLKINYMNVWNIEQKHPYIYGVATCTDGKSLLHTNVSVTNSIMEGTIKEKREKVKTLCNILFEIAKKHFHLKYVNETYKNCLGCLTPGHINIDIYLYTSEVDTIIAKWRGGKILYTDVFLK
jgi:hypothetical protein